MKKRTLVTSNSVSAVMNKIHLTKWIAGSPVTKKLGLNDDGTIEKLSTARHG